MLPARLILRTRRNACAVLLSAWSSCGWTGTIAPDLQRLMDARGTHADTSVIVRFSDAADLASVAVTDRRQRDNRVMLALQAASAKNMTALKPVLTALEATRIKNLWLINAVAVTLPAIAVQKLAQHPAVATIDRDAQIQSGRSQRTPAMRTEPPEQATPTDSADSVAPDVTRASGTLPNWNIQAVHAPEVWAKGFTGKGVVVAGMDTGVDFQHPLLRQKWRGGANSWFDPRGEWSTPYDPSGHGTQAMGVVLAEPDVGVAPDARWIAARLYDAQGRASMSDIHLAFQWLLDPDGDPATRDAPDIVNASWALTGRVPGSCILEFDQDIRALKAAGIAVVFAAGNDGPNPGSSSSPGNNPGVLSVGAIDRTMEIARQTSRGPSACDGAVFPTLLAPGVNIRTTDLSHGGMVAYTSVSGSSLAAPHVSGVLALLIGAFPSASVAELEAALVTKKSDSDSVRLDAMASFQYLQNVLKPGLIGN